jgi:hypothetical protein
MNMNLLKFPPTLSNLKIILLNYTKKIINLETVIINPKKYVLKNFGTQMPKAYFGIDSNDPK